MAKYIDADKLIANLERQNVDKKVIEPVIRIIDSLQQEQPEKDHDLTIKDLELLHIFLYAVKNNKQGVFTFTRLSDEQYNEVLRRFNEAKK